MDLFNFSKDLKKYKVKRQSGETIDPTEILLDSQADDLTGQFEVPLKQKYLLWFLGLIILSLGILIFRAGWLQIVKGDYYQEIAEGNRIQTFLIKAPRGVIYDQDGQQLVQNISSFDLVIIPNLLPEDEIHLRSLITLLSSMTGKSRQEIEKIISQSDPASLEPVLIQENLGREQVLILETKSWELSGVRLEENAIRNYIDGPYFSHLLGYPGKITKLELTVHPNYSLTDYIGKTGLEFTYESVLRGEPGQKKEEVDSSGEVRKVISFQESTPGYNLVLFLKADLQKKLTESLKKALQRTGASRASAIALDPRNGGILALVSLPNFDNNLFAQGISQEDYQSIIQNPDQPLFNRAISGEYPPGSTIKPLIALAALEENIISPEQQIYCSGVIGIPNQYNPQIITYFRDWKAHGATNLVKAIAQSGNVYFYTIGGGYGQIEGLGIERISKYVRLFGLGQSLGIDLPNEWSGLIPSRAWKEETFGERWYLGDTYHAAIGQGDIRVTPLQMTAAIAAVANGGKFYRPQVVKQIIDSDKNIIRDIKSEIIRKDFIKSKNIQIVQQGMREAIISGSSQALLDLPFKVAGKTGTAQFGTQGKTHAWFTSYAPFDNPEIVLTVLIEEGGEGSQAALPVAKEVLSWYLSQ